VVNVRRGGVILAILLLGSGLFASAGVDEDFRQGFPLSPGTSWVYRGFVRSWQEGSTVGKVTSVTWTMTVLRTFQREGILAAMVSGFPGDLDWSDGHAEPQLSILLRTPDAKFYINTLSTAGVTVDQIADEKFPLRDLVQDGDGFLQLPLAEGKRFFCDPGAAERDDSEYCWVTGASHLAALNGVKGVSPGARNAYELTFATNPDDTEIEFVDGVGITSYQYHHHGTVAETDLHLIEFRLAGDSNR
jgi:hypothetical protein